MAKHLASARSISLLMLLLTAIALSMAIQEQTRRERIVGIAYFEKIARVVEMVAQIGVGKQAPFSFRVQDLNIQEFDTSNPVHHAVALLEGAQAAEIGHHDPQRYLSTLTDPLGACMPSIVEFVSHDKIPVLSVHATPGSQPIYQRIPPDSISIYLVHIHRDCEVLTAARELILLVVQKPKMVGGTPIGVGVIASERLQRILELPIPYRTWTMLADSQKAFFLRSFHEIRSALVTAASRETGKAFDVNNPRPAVEALLESRTKDTSFLGVTASVRLAAAFMPFGFFLLSATLWQRLHSANWLLVHRNASAPVPLRRRVRGEPLREPNPNGPRPTQEVVDEPWVPIMPRGPIELCFAAVFALTLLLCGPALLWSIAQIRPDDLLTVRRTVGLNPFSILVDADRLVRLSSIVISPLIVNMLLVVVSQAFNVSSLYYILQINRRIDLR